MCGICGLAGLSGIDGLDERDSGAIGRMMATLVHRGPDEGGEVRVAAAGVALGHRRLRVIDLSARGRQPMAMPI